MIHNLVYFVASLSLAYCLSRLAAPLPRPVPVRVDRPRDPRQS